MKLVDTEAPTTFLIKSLLSSAVQFLRINLHQYQKKKMIWRSWKRWLIEWAELPATRQIVIRTWPAVTVINLFEIGKKKKKGPFALSWTWRYKWLISTEVYCNGNLLFVQKFSYDSSMTVFRLEIISLFPYFSLIKNLIKLVHVILVVKEIIIIVGQVDITGWG